MAERQKKADAVLSKMAGVSTREAKEYEAKKAGPTFPDGERVTIGEAAAGEQIPRKPTTPPSTNGSLSMMSQREAILQILGKAPRPLKAGEILSRLQVGGYHSRSENPLAALSVRLSEMRLSFERRAGKAYYQPISESKTEGGEN